MFRFLVTVTLAIGATLERIVPLAGSRSMDMLWKPRFFSSRETDELDDNYPEVLDDGPRNGPQKMLRDKRL